jgi:hypothetical protein
LWTNNPKRIASLPDVASYVALIYPGNTSPKQFSGRLWSSCSGTEIRHLMGGLGLLCRSLAGWAEEEARRGGQPAYRLIVDRRHAPETHLREAGRRLSGGNGHATAAGGPHTGTASADRDIV